MRTKIRSTLTLLTAVTSCVVLISAINAAVTQPNRGEALPVVEAMETTQEVESAHQETPPLVVDLPVLSVPVMATLPATTNLTEYTVASERRAQRTELETELPSRGASRQARGGFNFPSTVTEEAQAYLIEVYKQAQDASKHTKFPDPFMAMSLGVVEKPVSDHGVFRLPLVSDKVLKNTLRNGTYRDAIPQSSKGTSYGKFACEGPLQIAVGWVASEHRNPTIWKEAATMFYEDATLAIPGMTAFANKCGIDVNQEFLMTIASMRHNVGNLSDWANAKPDSSPNKSFIPFKTKRAVYEWNAAVASAPAQKAIKQAAYNSYKNYIDTGVYDNQGIGWKEIAKITGYPQSNITSSKEWWRPLFNVRFWYNYYLLQLLYGVETPAALGM